MAERMAKRGQLRQVIGSNPALFKPFTQQIFIFKLWEAV